MPLGPSLLNSSPATIVPGDFTGSMSLTPEAKKPAQPAVSLNDLPVEVSSSGCRRPATKACFVCAPKLTQPPFL